MRELSHPGRYTLTVTFDVGTDLDFAQVLVQNRMAAMSRLPGPVQQQGVVTKKKSTAILQVVTLTSTNKAHDSLSLYNLFPTATINGSVAPGFSSGQGLDAMEAAAAKTLGSGMEYEWTAVSYQEKLVGSSTYFIFALALLLVYFVLAGHYTWCCKDLPNENGRRARSKTRQTGQSHDDIDLE